MLLVGKTFGHIEQSSFLKKIHSITDGNPPKVNLINEKNNGEAVLNLINKNLVLSAHDVSDGGLILALIEMSLGSHLGAIIEKPKKLSNLIEFFLGRSRKIRNLEIEEENYKKSRKFT